jgi:transcription-repair coupling factor (superfamily II helicase)
VARFRVLCRRFGVTEVSLQGNLVRFSPVDLPESAQLRLQRLYDKSHYKPTVGTMSVPRPKGSVQPDGSFRTAAFGGQPLRDVALLAWCGQVLESVTDQRASVM